MTSLERLKHIAEVDFSEIVKSTIIINFKLRIILIDNSYIDINLSVKIPDKFGFHWETRNYENSIYRYDNFPDVNYRNIETFPYHFHNGSQDNVESAPFPQDIIPAVCAFMNYVREGINK